MTLGEGSSGGSGFVGYSRSVRVGEPARAGGFEASFWGGGVVSSWRDLFAVAQLRGEVVAGPALGLSDPVVVTLVPSVDLGAGFRVELGDLWLSSSGAVVPGGEVSSGGLRYWMWDAPCASLQAGVELGFRIVAGGGVAGFADALLGSLAVSGASLGALFDPAVLDYSAVADGGVDTVTVSAAAPCSGVRCGDCAR